MRIDAETWSRVTALFDRLVDLDPEARARELARIKIEADVRQWLNRLLDAHDQPDELVIDRTLNGIVSGLAETAGSTEADLPGPGEHLGPWLLVEELGRGGMGSVLLGKRADGRYDQTVAVKLLRPSAYGGIDLDAMDNEIRLLARLEHPGIVRLIEGGITPEGLPYLVMEHVSGEPIDRWCSSRNATLQTRLALIRQVTSALAHAHRRLVIHADIKPSNVLVSDDGRVRLVDFGIAGRLQESGDAEVPSMLRCSPAWCAPEQLQGAPPDVAQDVFGVGALLVRLLTGDRIRTGDRITRLLAGASIEDEPQPAPPSSRALAGLPVREIRGNLDAICAGALDADPGARYSSIEALDAELERWQRHEPVRAASLGRTARFALWFRRNRVPAVAGAVAGFAMLVGTAAAVWQADQARAAAAQARVQAERADSVRDFVLSLFRAADPLRVGGAELDTRTVLAQASKQLEDDVSLDRELRTEILNTLADVQLTLGWDADAAELIDAALELADAGPVAPHLAAETLLQHGELFVSRGEFGTALERLREGLTLLDAARDENSGTVRARLLLRIGAVLARTGQSRDANTVLARAEQTLAALAAPNPELAMLLASARGVAAYTAGEYPTAQRYMQETVEIQRRIGNAQRASMVTSLGNLAAVTAQLGDPEQALAYDREAVDIARAAFPEGHTTIGRALYAYGDSLRQLGRLDEADAALIESRSIQLADGKPAEVELVDLTRSRVLLAAGRHHEAAELIAPARSALAARWGNTSDVALQGLAVEIAARTELRQSERVAALERNALDLLAGLESDQQGRPIVNLLRWRLADVAMRDGRHAQASEITSVARSALRDSAPATLVLKLDALAVLLAISGGSPPDADDIKALREALERSGGNTDARAYAWGALAQAASELADDPLLAQAMDAIVGLRGEPTLTTEGARWLAEIETMRGG